MLSTILKYSHDNGTESESAAGSKSARGEVWSAAVDAWA